MLMMQLNVTDRERFMECVAAELSPCGRPFMSCVTYLLDYYGGDGTDLFLGYDRAPLTMSFLASQRADRGRQMVGVIHYDDDKKTFGVHT